MIISVHTNGLFLDMGRFDLENTNSDEHQQQFWEVGFSMNLKGLGNIPKMAAMMSVDMATL